MAEGSKCGNMVTYSIGSILIVSERVSGWSKVELWEDVNIFSWVDLPDISTIKTCSIASTILRAMYVKKIKVSGRRKSLEEDIYTQPNPNTQRRPSLEFEIFWLARKKL